MLSMGNIVNLTDWRRSRDQGTAADGSASPPFRVHPAGRGNRSVSSDDGLQRLDQAVRRLHQLVFRMLDRAGDVQPQVETELLAIMGELTMDLVNEAAARAERLAEHLTGEG